jgi:hypothetical protein
MKYFFIILFLIQFPVLGQEFLLSDIFRGIIYKSIYLSIHFEDKDYLAAINDYDFAIDMNPGDDSSYYYRGYAKHLEL